MAIKIIFDENTEDLQEIRRIYNLDVPVILNKYKLIISIMYEQMIFPHEPKTNFLRSFDIDVYGHALPNASNYFELECGLTRILSTLSEKGKLELDRSRGEILLAAQKITEEIRKVANRYEIIILDIQEEKK